MAGFQPVSSIKRIQQRVAVALGRAAPFEVAPAQEGLGLRVMPVQMRREQREVAEFLLLFAELLAVLSELVEVLVELLQLARRYYWMMLMKLFQMEHPFPQLY